MEQKKRRRFKRHADLVIISRDELPAFLSDADREAWLDAICAELKCERVAVQRKVAPDGFRTPEVELLRGEHGLVEHVDNGVRYRFDVRETMFSSGNIAEKLRVAQWDCAEEVVVDMFVGIGYFSLPLLLHARAKHLHAVDWNPLALRRFRENIRINKIDEQRVTVYEGDAHTVTPEGVAQRVLLGLIPTSRRFWRTAVRALDKQTGGVLVVHENVEGKEWRQRVEVELMQQLREEAGSNAQLELIRAGRVKCYAPHVHHIVFDVRVTFNVSPSLIVNKDH